MISGVYLGLISFVPFLGGLPLGVDLCASNIQEESAEHMFISVRRVFIILRLGEATSPAWEGFFMRLAKNECNTHAQASKKSLLVLKKTFS